jgi:hypothetical protein
MSATEPNEPKDPIAIEDEPEDENAPDSRDDALSNLLKKSLGAALEPPPAPAVEKILLKNVQRKIRKRSRGRFFADGWSTSAQRVSYVTIAILMLFVLAVAFFALAPSAIQ